MADVFNPMDPKWWPAGARLDFWDITALHEAGRHPAWLADPRTATRRLDHARTLKALGLIHSHRTVTTGQLHRLDPTLPASPAAGLWNDLMACRLIELGFPIALNGRTGRSPRTGMFMACRLPIHLDVTQRLAELGFNPFEIASLGPGPLRGARQYDRHNLICAELSARFRVAGWRTMGEAWGRFDLLFDDPTAGRGGPDLELVRNDGLVVAVEATATVTGIDEKIRRWNRLLAVHPDAGVACVWLDCSTQDNESAVKAALARIPGAAGRMRVASARTWLDGRLGVLADGSTLDMLSGPGRPRVDPSGWMGRETAQLAARFGLDATRWRRPAPLAGGCWA